MFRSIEISASGLAAQRMRIDAVAGNIANAHTTQAEDGSHQPFQRRLVVFQAQQADRANIGGVAVNAEVQIDQQTPPRKVHQPGHPHADADGYVAYPNVNIVTEYVNATEASRAYEANITAMTVSKEMIQGTFKILA